MFRNPYNPYEPDVLANITFVLAVIITLVITIIVLIKFFRMCRDVASIAELLKEQRQAVVSTTLTKEDSTESQVQPQTESVVDTGYGWIIWLLIIIVVIVGLFAILYNGPR